MDKIIFKSKKFDSVFLGLFAGLFVFLSGIALCTYFVEEDAVVFLPVGMICGLLLLINIASFYKLNIIIDGHFLRITFFFKVYETDVRNITKIRKGETMWSGFHKYGTGTKGLIVFAKFKNDLYITPENEDLFYQKILEINPEVVIENV